jgi:hypothetical protein
MMIAINAVVPFIVVSLDEGNILLLSQGNKGIDRGSSSRRDITRQHANDSQECSDRQKSHQVSRFNSKQRCREQARGAQAGKRSCSYTRNDQPQTVHKDLFQDGPAICAERYSHYLYGIVK